MDSLNVASPTTLSTPIEHESPSHRHHTQSHTFHLHGHPRSLPGTTCHDHDIELAPSSLFVVDSNSPSSDYCLVDLLPTAHTHDEHVSPPHHRRSQYRTCRHCSHGRPHLH